MRVSVVVVMALALAGCDDRHSKAEAIVTANLGLPTKIEFRDLRTKGDAQIVCGEVLATGLPEWRYFVAYLDLDKAVIEPRGGISKAAEMGNPLLDGARDEFYGACN